MSMQASTGVGSIRLATAIGALLASGAASAHALHGAGFGDGWAHPFLGLDHLLAMLVVGLWAVQLGGRWLWALPLSFVTAMCAGAVLAGAGLAPGTAASAIEPMVAASLLVFGLLLLARARLRGAAAPLIVALFALFHGAAHVADLQSGDALKGSITVYLAGMLLATAVLHGAGILAGRALLRSGLLRWLGLPVALVGAWLTYAVA
jgi:urease accessory protein